MITLVVAFLASLTITLILIRYEHLHTHLTADHDLDGVQKFHARAVPRVGGIGVFLGVLVGLTAKAWFDKDFAIALNLAFLVSTLPAFGAGLLEDLTKKVTVRDRLIATIFSALLGGVLLGGWITRLDLPLLDQLLREPHLVMGSEGFAFYGLFSLLLTSFAVSGVANAFNLIDGYNGLAGIVAVICLLGLAYVAYLIGDRFILLIALSTVGAILGFIVWNYPYGLIFLGDGGAYFIGFVIAELSVLIVVRNPGVSPWFPLLLNFYPIFETLFTIFRRSILGRKSPGTPDAAHLHQLVYRRLVRWAVGSNSIKHKTQRNALTSPYLWVLSSVAVIPALLFWQNSFKLQLCMLFFGLIYVWIYYGLLHLRFPKFIMIRKVK